MTRKITESESKWVTVPEELLLLTEFQDFSFSKEVRARNAVSKNLFLWRILVSRCHSLTFPREDCSFSSNIILWIHTDTHCICKLPCTTTFFNCVHWTTPLQTFEIMNFPKGSRKNSYFLLVPYSSTNLPLQSLFFILLATTSVSSVLKKEKENTKQQYKGNPREYCLKGAQHDTNYTARTRIHTS